MRAANAGTLAEIGQQHPAMSEAELELTRVKRELAEVKMERDLLKCMVHPYLQGAFSLT
jgi:transposase